MTITGRSALLLTRHRNVLIGDDRQLRRAAARGDLKKLKIGAYVPAAIWDSLSPEQRRRLAAAAAAELSDSFVASHRSAGALWRIPSIAPNDGLVHSRVTVAAGTRTEHGFRKHAVADLELQLTTIDGIAVTTLERTVLDLAATESFSEGVVAADWALGQGVTKGGLRVALDEWAPGRGRARVEKVIDFANGASGSAGESWSRVLIAEAGLPAPILQAEFHDQAGFIALVDFYWPAFELIGEFDGFVKYSKPEFLAGRTPSEVVMAEKRREDRLRASSTRPGVSRWVWGTLQQHGALSLQLQGAGLLRSGPIRTVRA